MDLIVTNAAIFTGDGHTYHRIGHICITDGRIARVSTDGPDLDASDGAPILDAHGETAFPGLINAHAHGCIDGPVMPSGSRPFSLRTVAYARNRHLLGGTTTLVNVCGLALPGEIDLHDKQRHPLQIFVTTAHTPSSIAAAHAVDGEGLTEAHSGMTVDSAIKLGAIALGEGGGGQTLGGGAQDYGFVPRAILRATGVCIEPRDARLLKEALFGRGLGNKARAPNRAFTDLCQRLGLTDSVSPGDVASLLSNSVMGPIAHARRGLDELAKASSRIGLPAILHTAVPSASNVIDLAQKYPDAQLIAAHCNHPSFTPDEATSTAARLRALGVAIDVCTLDTISTRWRNTPGNFDALVSAGLVDTLSTDFAGGHWDGILEAIHRMITRGQLSSPAAVALATGNVARRFPAFHDRGVLEVGKRADITIADSKNLSRVRHVIIGGEVVVQDGAIVP